MMCLQSIAQKLENRSGKVKTVSQGHLAKGEAELQPKVWFQSGSLAPVISSFYHTPTQKQADVTLTLVRTQHASPKKEATLTSSKSLPGPEFS